MTEWLHYFQHHIGDEWQVALMLNNFSPHQIAVNAMKEQGLLKNINIIWLPANATAVYQPMDQGIIRSWKAHCRCSMMRFILRKVEKDNSINDPYAEINMLHAIRWSVEAWRTGVTVPTIVNCYHRSQLLIDGPTQILDQEQQDLLQVRELEDVEQDIAQTIRAIYPEIGILNCSQIAQFVHPDHEIIENSIEEEEQRIIDAHVPVSETDKLDPARPPPEEPRHITYLEALQAHETLSIFRLQHHDLAQQSFYQSLQDDSQKEVKWIQSAALADHINKGKQRAITSFFATSSVFSVSSSSPGKHPSDI